MYEVRDEYFEYVLSTRSQLRKFSTNYLESAICSSGVFITPSGNGLAAFKMDAFGSIPLKPFTSIDLKGCVRHLNWSGGDILAIATDNTITIRKYVHPKFILLHEICDKLPSNPINLQWSPLSNSLSSTCCSDILPPLLYYTHNGIFAIHFPHPMDASETHKPPELEIVQINSMSSLCSTMATRLNSLSSSIQNNLFLCKNNKEIVVLDYLTDLQQTNIIQHSNLYPHNLIDNNLMEYNRNIKIRAMFSTNDFIFITYENEQILSNLRSRTSTLQASTSNDVLFTPRKSTTSLITVISPEENCSGIYNSNLFNIEPQMTMPIGGGESKRGSFPHAYAGTSVLEVLSVPSIDNDNDNDNDDTMGGVQGGSGMNESAVTILDDLMSVSTGGGSRSGGGIISNNSNNNLHQTSFHKLHQDINDNNLATTTTTTTTAISSTNDQQDHHQPQDSYTAAGMRIIRIKESSQSPSVTSSADQYSPLSRPILSTSSSLSPMGNMNNNNLNSIHIEPIEDSLIFTSELSKPDFIACLPLVDTTIIAIGSSVSRFIELYTVNYNVGYISTTSTSTPISTFGGSSDGNGNGAFTLIKKLELPPKSTCRGLTFRASPRTMTKRRSFSANDHSASMSASLSTSASEWPRNGRRRSSGFGDTELLAKMQRGSCFGFQGDCGDTLDIRLLVMAVENLETSNLASTKSFGTYSSRLIIFCLCYKNGENESSHFKSSTTAVESRQLLSLSGGSPDARQHTSASRSSPGPSFVHDTNIEYNDTLLSTILEMKKSFEDRFSTIERLLIQQNESISILSEKVISLEKKL